MESPLDRVIVEEIALEGLDGITLQALFVRLKNVKNFSLGDVDDQLVKEYIWRCIICNERLLTHRYLQMYLLPQPREKFIYYNRYESVDPMNGCPKESKDVPGDIFDRLYPTCKDGVMGSCQFYDERINVTDEFRLPVTLTAIEEKYGDKLVIVANQELRNEALGINSIDASLNLHVATYSYLEKVGRSRHLGLPSVGKESLKIDPGTVFYYRKKLKKDKLLRTKSYSYVNSSGTVCVGRITFLNRFYPRTRLPTATENMALRISEYLSEQENQECDWPVILNLLSGYHKKQINNMLAEFQKNFRLVVKELKDSRFSKKRITLIKPVVFDSRDEVLSDEEEDEDDAMSVNDTIKSEIQEDTLDDRVRAYDASLFLVDRCLLSQVLTFIERSSAVTESELADKFCLSRLDARALLKSLTRKGCTKIVKDIQGKTKVNKFVPLHKIGDANALFDSASQGLSHDSKNDTVVYLNRANIVLRLLESAPDNILVGLAPIIKEIQEKENTGNLIDRRTVMRIINRLESEGKLRHYSTDIPIKNRILSVVAICHRDTQANDPLLLERFAKYKNNERHPAAKAGTGVTGNEEEKKKTRKKPCPQTKVKSAKKSRRNCSTASENDQPIDISVNHTQENLKIENNSTVGDDTLMVDESNAIDVTFEAEQVFYLDTACNASTSAVGSIIPATLFLPVTPITRIAAATTSYSRGNTSSPSPSRKRSKLFDEASQHIILQKEPPPLKEKKERIKRTRKAYYDDKDHQAMSNLRTIRCRWSHSEDRFLKFCRVSSLLLDPNCNTNICVPARVLRDELQERVPASRDKTAKACQRRIAYLLKNAATRRQISDLVSEVRQSEALLDIERPDVPKTQEKVWTGAFLNTLVKVLEKFSASNCNGQDEITFEEIDFTQFHLVDSINSEKESKPAFYSPESVHEILCNVISNVMLSSLLVNKLNDGKKFQEQLFNIYKKYPDPLLRTVISRFKATQILANIKKNNSRNSEQTSGPPMSFKISAAFDLLLQTKLTMDQLIRPIKHVDQSIIQKQIHDRSDACYTTCMFAAKKVTFSLEIPDDHITLNDKHYSKPVMCPSPKGKGNTNSNTGQAADRVKSSRSFLYALRKQMELQTSSHNKQDKLSDLLVLNNCPVDVSVKEDVSICQSFHDKLKSLCEPVAARSEEEISQVLQRVSADSLCVDILNFVEEKREIGATAGEIISHFGYWPRVQVEQLITHMLLFRLGVDTFHLVHVRHINDWIVECVDEKGESIKFIPKIWRDAFGRPVKIIIYQMMAALVGHIVINPGLTVASLLTHFAIAAPAVQLMETLELLQCAQCISLVHLEPTGKPKLFTPVMEVKSINLQMANIGQDVENEELLCEATPEALVKLGLLKSLLTCG